MPEPLALPLLPRMITAHGGGMANRMTRSSTPHVSIQRCEDLPIMLIDNDVSFRGALMQNLRDDGHEVLEYGAPGDVPPVATLPEVKLVIGDSRMVGGDGLALADLFHAARPTVPVLIVTAYCSYREENEVAARDFMRCLCRPLDYEEIHALVHEVAGRPAT